MGADRQKSSTPASRRDGWGRSRSSRTSSLRALAVAGLATMGTIGSAVAERATLFYHKETDRWTINGYQYNDVAGCEVASGYPTGSSLPPASMRSRIRMDLD